MQNNSERGAGIVSLLLFNIPEIGLLAQERLGGSSLSAKLVNSFIGFIPALEE